MELGELSEPRTSREARQVYEKNANRKTNIRGRLGMRLVVLQDHFRSKTDESQCCKWCNLIGQW